MTTPKTTIVAGLAALLSLGVASGAAWAQTSQDTTKMDAGSDAGGQSTLKKSQKSETNAQSGQSAEGSGQMKAEGDQKQMKGSADQNAQAQTGDSGSKAKQQTSSDQQMKKDDTQKQAEDSGSKTKKQQASSDEQMKKDDNKTQAQDQGSKTDENSSMQSQDQRSGQNKNSASDNTATEGKNKTDLSKNDQGGGTSTEKTGSVNVNVTSEQKTEIRQVITETHVQPVEHVDFDVDVGVAIPHTVELHPLPPRIVKIVPEYESYEYFVLADGRIVIVDPDSWEIVYVIVA